MKFCTDCKHMAYYYENHEPDLTHRSAVCMRPDITSLVTGKQIPQEHSQCWKQRAGAKRWRDWPWKSKSFCGPEGKFWEAKP